ncbi:MAG: formate dehydrogenase accessory sulfurtransferase FdhD [Eggerthellaceae bacterium]|jgi:FdhD protein|nr:formate dehydrogenase accessory sulfurtransferase FdhD [Eggerthellaceae bacterium]MDR2721604.1 formate dehydrogenase accessory sulfurtransferase FdhD [Coriobacteriaceae bacterium]
MAVLIERKHHVKESSRERAIQILFNNKPLAISQGTPENLSELAVGFLLAEGLISDRQKLRTIDANVEAAWVNVVSDEDCADDRPLLHRVTSSGCVEAALLKKTPSAPFISADSTLTFAADDLLAMMEQLCAVSPKRNGGECVHGCGIGNNGKLVCVREDVGRHNAMDKLIGQAWLDGIVMQDMALFTTGRISYEMALKAAHSGVSVMVSHKSATDSAIELAESLNLTLVGKCRDNAMQVLSHHRRILD